MELRENNQNQIKFCKMKTKFNDFGLPIIMFLLMGSRIKPQKKRVLVIFIYIYFITVPIFMKRRYLDRVMLLS